MESVYLETTFISYLVSAPSRDLIIAAHQRITSDWWVTHRYGYDCFVSQFVIDEASSGDPTEAAKRLEVIAGLEVADASPESERLAAVIIESGAIPHGALNDAAHIAVAAVHGINYLLTWNCRHLANAHILRKVRAVCEENGFWAPDICTPEELMEDE